MKISRSCRRTAKNTNVRTTTYYSWFLRKWYQSKTAIIPISRINKSGMMLDVSFSMELMKDAEDNIPLKWKNAGFFNMNLAEVLKDGVWDACNLMNS